VIHIGIFVMIIALAVSLHEIGHAVPMHHRGIEIEKMGIGISIWPTVTLRHKRISFPVVFSPWLLAAYVMPSSAGNAHQQTLSYRDQAICYGGGPLANIVSSLGAFAGAVSVAMIENPAWRSVAGISILMLMAYACWKFRYFITQYVFLVLCILMLVFFVSILASSGDDKTAWGEFFDSLGTLSGVLKAYGVISLALGLINLSPIIPLDGGRIVNAGLQALSWERAQSVFRIISFLVFPVFVVFNFGKGWLF
jgi:membrane-associated protease RseP (regulator of RpoE activity)